MKSIAIIGTGIAGMACAHYLRAAFHLTLFERENYAGGHTNTVLLPEADRQIPVDTGFMVYNETTYPHLVRLFRELEIPIKPTDMSFGVRHEPDHIEYSGASLNHLFAQCRNVFRHRFWQMIQDIFRFHKEAESLLAQPDEHEEPLSAFLTRNGYSTAFRDYYILPMTSAIWSAERDTMLRFPVITLVRFFKNHGLLGVKGRLPWLTVDGGSRVYRDKILAPLANSLFLQCPVVQVERTASQVRIHTAGSAPQTFDYAIIATHADEALELLAQRNIREEELLGKFRYTRNLAQLHSDESVMPRHRLAWASWNYHISRDSAGVEHTSTHYWMNNLQKVSPTTNYFVSLNAGHLIDSRKVHRTFLYTHPVFDLPARNAQRDLPKLNQNGPVFFCGSYFRYGFHEDALMSSLAVCEKLLNTRLLLSSS